MGVIAVRNLCKSFGGVEALRDVDFVVEEGSITGFLGPNGAGKSTTMNILMGFINASSGEAEMLGEKVAVSNYKVHEDVGFLSANMALDKNLTVEQEFEYFGNLTGKYNAAYARELAKKLDLDMGAKIKNLSTGNHQKTALIVALMNRPRLLILDEPTNGLDPLVQAEFNNIVRELNRAGTTVFISSHILGEVSELCDYFIFIKKGEIAGKLTKDELLAKSAKTISVKYSEKNVEKLRAAKVAYKVEQADLESSFMSFYEEGEHGV